MHDRRLKSSLTQELQRHCAGKKATRLLGTQGVLGMGLPCWLLGRLWEPCSTHHLHAYTDIICRPCVSAQQHATIIIIDADTRGTLVQQNVTWLSSSCVPNASVESRGIPPASLVSAASNSTGVSPAGGGACMRKPSLLPCSSCLQSPPLGVVIALCAEWRSLYILDFPSHRDTTHAASTLA